MSKISDMLLNIQDAIVDAGSNLNFEEIAAKIGCPVDWVESEYEAMYDASLWMGDDYDGQPDEAQEWHDFDPDC